jgi:hypothetical protein
MKTLLLKSGKWVVPGMLFTLLIILLNLNLVKRVDQMINRVEFEAFLQEKITEFITNNAGASEQLSSEVTADSPDQAALQDYLNTIDPELKTVPKERLKQAYEYAHSIQKDKAYKSVSSLEWQGTEANFGGRVRAVLWDPNDASLQKVWAGGVTGGLWYKDNINDTGPWIPVDDFWPGLSVSCMTYDPNQKESFYVGTGEAQTALIIYRESSGVGYGIQHSTDAGQTWEVMPGTEEFEYITDIEIRDEDGTSVIYAGVASGVYKGVPHLSDPSDGLFRSVVGSGDWEQVLPMIEEQEVPFAPSDIEIGADGRIYIGTMPNVEGDGAATILYSDSGLPGSWHINSEYRTLIENTPGINLPGRVILASAPSDADRIYALIAQGWFSGIPAYQCHIIARSEDKGDTWEMASIPPDNSITGNWAFIAWHALTAAVDPADPDRIYVGALDMYVSENAGDSWTKKSNWTNTTFYNYVHADHHRILYQPGSSDVMLVATDGGIFLTDAATQSTTPFEEVNYGFNTLQYYKVALHPTPGTDFFLGGMQDNGSVFYDGTPIEHLNRISGGDGGACFIDQDEPGIMITSHQNNNFYIFSNNQQTGMANSWASGNFISSVAYDYRLNTLYANAVTVVNNNQDLILRISGIPDPPFTGDFLDMETGSTVPFTHVKYSEYSPESSSTLFLGTQSGRLFKVENAESDPVVAEIGSDEFPAAAVSCIAQGGSEDTMLVTFSNYGVPSVWQTYSGGADWAEREGNLPDMPVRWAIYHPQNATAAMLATEVGIWTSYQLDSESPVWQPDNEGLANVRIDMLQLREADNTVLAGTHGRGFYSATFNYDPTTGVAAHLTDGIAVVPNPARESARVMLPESCNGTVNFTIVALNGEVVSRNACNCDASYIQVDLSNLSPGTYFLRINDGKHVQLKKFIKI